MNPHNAKHITASVPLDTVESTGGQGRAGRADSALCSVDCSARRGEIVMIMRQYDRPPITRLMPSVKFRRLNQDMPLCAAIVERHCQHKQ